MHKVLTFLENQIQLMETTLNEYKGYEIVATWTLPNKIVFVLKKSPQPGRPKKTEASEE
jgi:hypothetical protein